MIPGFTVNGLLPPFVGSSPTDMAGRAPFVTTIVDVVDRYANSPERLVILDGLLRYREALHRVGLVSGFQWIDGSFSEAIEAIENRPPNDVDVVTFYYRPASATSDPAWAAFQAQNQRALEGLFRSPLPKQSFKCDAYPVELDMGPIDLVSFTHYCFGLFSHRRQTFEWKGLIEVPLFDAVLDGEARRLLTARGGP
ncbi:MAG: DUF6932 family protein [Acetobacteraceae bacterium]|jgi:hypothetical protein